MVQHYKPTPSNGEDVPSKPPKTVDTLLVEPQKYPHDHVSIIATTGALWKLWWGLLRVLLRGKGKAFQLPGFFSSDGEGFSIMLVVSGDGIITRLPYYADYEIEKETQQRLETLDIVNPDGTIDYHSDRVRKKRT